MVSAVAAAGDCRQRRKAGGHRPSWQGWRKMLAGCALFVCARAQAAEPVPVSVRTAPGRFEISAIDASVAHTVAAAGEEAWRVLAAPLQLPEAFSSPIYVRVISAAQPGAPAAFRVIVEPGGIVSARVFGAAAATSMVQRALVQALLLRLAVARQGVHERIGAPLWLEHGCVGWWQTHAEAAQLDAVKQESQRIAPPALAELLAWQRGRDEPRAFSIGALWLFTFLQGESGRSREWPNFVQRLLGGDDPLSALGTCYPDRFTDATERELWWKTGYHRVRRAHALPILEATESQTELGALARFVFAASVGDEDRLVSLRDVLARAEEPVVAAELARRTTDLERLIPALHPFYRNAGLALAEALRTKPKNAVRRDALCAAFEQDWRDAVELHTATTGALDALEGRASVLPTSR
jgi:hypothetical protein